MSLGPRSTRKKYTTYETHLADGGRLTWCTFCDRPYEPGTEVVYIAGDNGRRANVCARCWDDPKRATDTWVDLLSEGSRREESYKMCDHDGKPTDTWISCPWCGEEYSEEAEPCLTAARAEITHLKETQYKTESALRDWLKHWTQVINSGGGIAVSEMMNDIQTITENITKSQ